MYFDSVRFFFAHRVSSLVSFCFLGFAVWKLVMRFFGGVCVWLGLGFVSVSLLNCCTVCFWAVLLRGFDVVFMVFCWLCVVLLYAYEILRIKS